MKRTLLFLGSVLIVVGCDRPATAPVKLDATSANECVWYKLGDSDSTLVCN